MHRQFHEQVVSSRISRVRPALDRQLVSPGDPWTVRVQIERSKAWVHSSFLDLADVDRLLNVGAVQREKCVCQSCCYNILELLLPSLWRRIGPIEGTSSSHLPQPRLRRPLRQSTRHCLFLLLVYAAIEGRWRLEVTGRPRMLELMGFAEGKNLRGRLESMRKRVVVIGFACIPWSWTSEGKVAQRDAFEMPQLPIL